MANDDPKSLGDAAPGAQALPKLLAKYRDPSLPRSLTEIAITALPFIALWAGMWALLHVSYWLTLLLAIPAAGFLVRLFMIQHDCSHGAFFRTRALNDWVGRVIGVATLTPYDYWKRTHAAHHATSGNLDRRGIGDVETLTVSEYLAMRWPRRLAYRLYRHPAVMFGLGPAYLFIFCHRAPLSLMRGAGWSPWSRLADRHRAVPHHSPAGRPALRVDGRLALLCAAPVRGDDLGARACLVTGGSRATRQLAL